MLTFVVVFVHVSRPQTLTISPKNYLQRIREMSKIPKKSLSIVYQRKKKLHAYQVVNCRCLWLLGIDEVNEGEKKIENSLSQ